ncbi:MAG: acetylglutamate kinase [Hyphomicrobiales bacterium]|nr:MAG: acetylglutamate kinase [Hyphomicrobiales bacterium]
MTDKSDKKFSSDPIKVDPALHERARLLSEALPYLQHYDSKTVVIKYGGHAMGDERLARLFARDVVLLKQVGINPVIVHGGGPQIGKMLARLNIKSEFAGGLRVTDAQTIDVVEMVLSGSINKQIVTNIGRHGGHAIGISGKDDSLMIARKSERKTVSDPDSNLERVVDLGFVGEPEQVNPQIINVVINSNLIPVIAPIGISRSGETFNINADTFAGALAASLGAKRLLLMTDVRGVLDDAGELIGELSVEEARTLVREQVVSGGMIPKLETCIQAVEGGVEAVVINDGRVPHALLLELYTEHGAGTLIS